MSLSIMFHLKKVIILNRLAGKSYYVLFTI